jgi:hypothetical protein
MAIPYPNTARPRRWRRGILIVLALLIALGMAGFGYRARRSDSALHDAIAESDRLDPGWRLEELEAKRRRPPNGENSADVVQAVHALIPKSWPSRDRSDPTIASVFQFVVPTLPPPMGLAQEHNDYLIDALEESEEALLKARSLANFPAGRFSVVFKPDYWETSANHLQEVRTVFRLLGFNALIQAHEGDIDGAIASLQAALNASRALGDEPFMISMLVRCAGRGVMFGNLERVLAQGEASEDALLSVQHLLEAEAADPLLLIGLRGNRAGWGHNANSIQQGIINPPNPTSSLPGEILWKVFNPWQEMFADVIRAYNSAVEIAKRPLADQPAAFQELTSQTQGLAPPAADALNKFVNACRRTQALMNSAAAAVAAERFRLKHGRWPDTLAELSPAFLREVPIDPYDGKPLRFRRLLDGVVIYAIAPAGTYNGRSIAPPFNPDLKGVELGFQLWDVNQRRQPYAEVIPMPRES